MKNQIIRLIFSSAIFITNPLFAVPPGDAESETLTLVKGASYPFPSAIQKELYTHIDENAGRGELRVLAKDNITDIIANLSLEDISTVSLVSKALHNLCQVPLVWESIAKREFIYVNLLEPVKEQIKNYFTLFTDPQKTYTLTAAHLQFIAHQAYKNWDSQSQNFLLRKKERIYFRALCRNNNGLDVLPPETNIEFKFNKDYGGFNSTFYVDKRLRNLVSKESLEQEPWFSQPSSPHHATNSFGFKTLRLKEYCSEAGKMNLPDPNM